MGGRGRRRIGRRGEERKGVVAGRRVGGEDRRRGGVRVLRKEEEKDGRSALRCRELEEKRYEVLGSDSGERGRTQKGWTFEFSGVIAPGKWSFSMSLSRKMLRRSAYISKQGNARRWNRHRRMKAEAEAHFGFQ